MSNTGYDAGNEVPMPGNDRTPLPRVSRRGFLGMGAAVSAGLLVPGCGTLTGAGDEAEGDGTGTINVLMMKGDGGRSGLSQMVAAFRKANPDISVNMSFTAYEELHDKIVAAAALGTFDVVQIDVIWPPEFATKDLLVDLTKRFPESWRRDMLAGAVQTGMYQDRIYGVPWILDTKYLFANTAHLNAAGIRLNQLETWDGVINAAKVVKERGIADFPLVWSWAESEALLCDYTQLLGAFGGRFLDAEQRPAFNTGGGLRALEFMKRTLDEGLTDRKSLSYLDDGVTTDFTAGTATLALNWTYMISSANDPAESKVAGKTAMLRTPEGVDGNRPGVNGNMALGITSGSQKRKAAWKFIEHLSSRQLQNTYSQNALPVWKSSYNDPVVRRNQASMVGVARAQLDAQVSRPALARYFVLAQVIQAEVAAALKGEKPPKKALDDAARVVDQGL